MGTFAADVKHAFRMFRQNPGFTVTAVAALALGIGANTAIFSVINAVILKPLPYPDAGRIVALMNTSPQGTGSAASVPKYNVWRRQASVLEDVAAYDTGGPGMNLTGGDRPEQVKGIHVSYEFFHLFGAQTALGRTFTQEEDRPRGGNFVVLSNGIWQRRFGSDPAIVGKSLALGGESYRVLGVLSRSFAFDPAPDLYLPFQADPNSVNQGHFFRVAARLKPGVALDSAKAVMHLAGEEFRRAFPDSIGPRNSFTVEPMQDLMVRDVRKTLYILMAAVGCVLLIACANVANLLLARATGRAREIAIRCAIGAGRGRIISQLLTESVLLSAMGGVAGLALGAVGVRALLAVNPGNIPRIGENGSAVTLDATVLGITLLLSLITGVLFGLVPAFHASRVDINSTLKEATSRSGSGLRQNKARSVLVITEMALAIVLLVGAGLLIRTFAALHTVAPGFDPHNVLTMDTALTGTNYDQTAAITTMSRQAVERMEAIPGVQAAAATSYLPLEGGLGLGFIIQGRPLTNGPAHGGAGWNYVTPHFFDVFKIPVVRGRVFTERDDGAAPPVVVINEAMAKQYWKNEDPIGQRLIIGSGMGPDFVQAPREIIGIIADARDAGLNSDPQPATFIPLSQVRDAYMKLNNRFMPLSWVVRTRVDPFSVSPAIQRAFQEVADLPVAHVRTMDRIIIQSTSRDEFNTLVLGVFAFAAILLASIGLYGLMAYSVEQRTLEFGIRLALGADFGQLRNMVVRQAMQLALIGIAIGLAAAFGLTRFMATLLFNVKPNDPAVFASVAGLLCGVALLASYIPARRALRVDPVIALRYQ
ncbi:MAG TPA: ABC transporter permease [Candidatus Sulfopaludibacter sp.]|jgi:predicted permease|nr:ABC transporter permease [Candidatus Sulfopaludibacter sp.]